MLERAIISVILIGLGIVVYRLWQAYTLRQAHQESEFNTGKPTVVLFTADFCQPCKTQQMPALQRLTTEMEQVEVIRVDVQAQPEMADKWKVLSLPTTFVLDKTGKPRHVNYGVTSTEKLKQQLEGLGS